jgi:hypothetical protein
VGFVTDVPLNTILADLDDGLRGLLRRELERHGFEGVEISFDAPSRAWSEKLTGPTISLFLYDLREATDQAEISGGERRGNGRAEVTLPDLRLEATYAVTAWSKAVEDEHRLLSQLVAILHTYRQLPANLVAGRTTGAGAIQTVLGRPMSEKADFWTAVGGQYKASIDFALRISVASGAVFERGPEVRTQVVRTVPLDGPRGMMVELFRFGGAVRDAHGDPVADAWVAMPELGAWTSSDSSGHFVFDRVRPGSYDMHVRTATGGQTTVKIGVPGPPADLVIGPSSQPAKRTRRAAP